MIPDLRKRRIADLEMWEITRDPSAPTILLFHGFGARARDLVSLSALSSELPSSLSQATWLFPNGPLSVSLLPGYSGRAWFPVDIASLREAVHRGDMEGVSAAFPKELSEVRGQIERLIEALDLPRSQLIVGGFSQGAVLATEVALHGASRVRALLIFSGTLIYPSQWRALAPLHAGTPLFQSHGTQDDILPLETAQELEALLQTGGLLGHLDTFPGGHGISAETLQKLTIFLSTCSQGFHT